MQDKMISIVIPTFNEGKNIPMIAGEIEKVFQGLQYGYEIIFVNDGSSDDSILELKKLALENKKVKVLDFSRNFGKEVATSAGCHAATGDAVVTMDGDLQHPPVLIVEMIKKWEAGAEVIYTVRNENEGASLTKRITSQLYWWLFSKISSVNSEPHSTDFRLMDKKVIDAFKTFPERGRIFRGIIDWMGFKRDRIEFTAPKRSIGTPTYSYKKLFGLAINSLTAFSLLPLKMAGYFGIIITGLSSIMLIVMLASKIFGFLFFTPIAIIVVANTFLIGLVLICLVFIALYIARIHDEVGGRPLYVIRDSINLDNNE